MPVWWPYSHGLCSSRPISARCQEQWTTPDVAYVAVDVPANCNEVEKVFRCGRGKPVLLTQGFGLALALDLLWLWTWLQYSLKSKSYEEMSYEKKKNGQTVISDDLSALAPQVGLEPTTPWLTVRCSNQLSYWGILSTFSVVCSFRECKGTTKID